MSVQPVARPRVASQRSLSSAPTRVRPRSAPQSASIVVEVAVAGPEALETATRLAGRIRDLVESANAEATGVDVSASVGLQIGAGNGAHRIPRPTLSSVDAPALGHAGPVPLPTFVAPTSVAQAPVAQAPVAQSLAAQSSAARAAASTAAFPAAAYPAGAFPAGTLPAAAYPPGALSAGAPSVGGAQRGGGSSARVGAAADASAAPLRIYPARRVALLGGEQLSLTRREFDLLLFLSEHAGRVFDRPQLLRLVWGHQVICGERTVDVHIRRLRAKVEGTGPVISTVRGVGYRLDAAERVAVLHEG